MEKGDEKREMREDRGKKGQNVANNHKMWQNMAYGEKSGKMGQNGAKCGEIRENKEKKFKKGK